jgi:hypothetical protein
MAIIRNLASFSWKAHATDNRHRPRPTPDARSFYRCANISTVSSQNRISHMHQSCSAVGPRRQTRCSIIFTQEGLH